MSSPPATPAVAVVDPPVVPRPHICSLCVVAAVTAIPCSACGRALCDHLANIALLGKPTCGPCRLRAMPGYRNPVNDNATDTTDTATQKEPTS